MKRFKKHEKGVVLIAVAVLIMVLLGFTVIGFEVGRWFVIRAELSKSVDSAALVAAKNLSNPYVDPVTLAVEFGRANFPSGYLSPGSGGAAATFTAEMLASNMVRVNGQVTDSTIAPGIVGFNSVHVASSGVAQKRQVEIMLVLDRSYSMVGPAIASLKDAANHFVDNFSETQDKDKLGLISFGSSVKINRALGTNYVTAMHTAITSMVALGGTNAEDAIDQSDGPSGFTDQSATPSDQRVQQFLVFFSDGQPTAFRGNFLRAGVTIDGVAGVAGGNCVPGDVGTVYDALYRTDVENTPIANADDRPTGNGIASVTCPGAGGTLSGQTTRWYIFDTSPVPGYAPMATCIPTGDLTNHVCDICTGLALQHGQELKNKNVMIFTIGLGKDNASFLKSLASSPELYYSTPDHTELDAIFQKIAKEITLRLVQ